MIAIITIGVFFLLLVLIYPMVCAAITLLGARKKQKARKLCLESESIQEIDQSIDQLKRSAFTISLVLTFFVLAPFIALVVITDLL